MSEEIIIEQEFFKTFGIKPNGYKCKDYSCICCDEYETCTKGKFSHITDRVLLELICIYNEFNIMDFYCKSTNIKQLKITILNYCIFTVEHNCNAEQFKAQVQSLFREEGE